MDGGAEGQLGVVPRMAKQLFNSLTRASILGWSYTITASFMEIYDEKLFDLLNTEQEDIQIQEPNAESETEMFVFNMTHTKVNDEAQLNNLIRIARSNRAAAAITDNERSSRSHAVTRLEIQGKHATRPEVLDGFINIVELAGSETEGDQSLSEMRDAILELAQKKAFVSHSKLARILMPSLGGNSKMLMFVNLSPFKENFNESVKSLRFAAEVNSYKMAKPKRNK